MTPGLVRFRARQPSLLRRLNHTPLRDLFRGRLTGRLDLDGLVAAAGLPEALSDLVQGVVRRTRLTRLEKVDVAGELVAHFQDGLAAGASADELATSFGDPKQAARLIRRAKLRGRHVVWRASRYAQRALQRAFLLLLVVYAVQALRMYSGSPRIGRDLLAEWNAESLALPETERAWPIYRAAALATGEWPEETLLLPDDECVPGGKGWPCLAEFAAENAEVIKMYRRAASMPRLGAVLSTSGDRELDRRYKYPYEPEADEPQQPSENALFIGVRVPQRSVFREARRLLTIDAYTSAEAGDSARALKDFHALFGIVRHGFQMRIVVAELTTLSLAESTCELTGSLLKRYPGLFNDAQLMIVGHELAGLGGRRDLSLDVGSEWAYIEDILQRYYTDDGSGDGFLGPELLALGSHCSDIGWSLSGIPAKVAAPVFGSIMAGKRETAERLRALRDRYAAEAALPLWQRGADCADQELKELGESRIGSVRHFVILHLMPCLSETIRESEYTIQVRDATLAAIALELYRRGHGCWPASLSELTPRLLPEVPPDRYDGRPLKYRLKDGDPLLYSVGFDRDDDGGRLPTGWHANWRARRGPLPDYLPYSPADGTLDQTPDGDWILWPPMD